MKKKYIAVFAVLIIALSSFVLVFAQPGTIEDPLVSQSYVDARIDEVVQMILALGGLPAGAEGVSFGTFEPVFVPAGSSVLAGEGTEIILRGGGAVALVPAVDGIVNITTGQEMTSGQNIPFNNLLIIPREDGRGVTTTANSWLLIRGSYTIQ